MVFFYRFVVALLWFQFHAVTQFTPCWQQKGLTNSFCKRTKVHSKLWHASFSLQRFSRPQRLLKCHPLGSITISSHLPIHASVPSQLSNGFGTGRARLSLHSYTFAPSVSFIWATWDPWVPTTGKGVDLTGPRQGCDFWVRVNNHFTQLLICMEWLWSSDSKHPMIWTQSTWVEAKVEPPIK